MDGGNSAMDYTTDIHILSMELFPNTSIEIDNVLRFRPVHIGMNECLANTDSPESCTNESVDYQPTLFACLAPNINGKSGKMRRCFASADFCIVFDATTATINNEWYTSFVSRGVEHINEHRRYVVLAAFVPTCEVGQLEPLTHRSLLCVDERVDERVFERPVSNIIRLPVGCFGLRNISLSSSLSSDAVYS